MSSRMLKPGDLGLPVVARLIAHVYDVMARQQRM